MIHPRLARSIAQNAMQTYTLNGRDACRAFLDRTLGPHSSQEDREIVQSELRKLAAGHTNGGTNNDKKPS